jgi:serine protease Do
VNFAGKGAEALGFLRRAGVAPAIAESRGAERSAAEVGETAHRSTVFIRCEM